MRQAGWAVPRPRLLERLRKGARGRLTVVTGPPGSGKTIAVSLWAAIEAQRPGPVIWVCCTEVAGAERGFASSVAQGLARAGIDVPAAIRSGAGGAGGAGALDGMVAFLDTLSTPVVLVLDDFRPERDTAVAEGVTHLLSHAAPGLRVVLTSRTDPPLPLNRYRLVGELTEIRSAELAFQEGEAAAVLAQHGVGLGGAAMRSLCERTEGWAAGIRLAALSMQAHPAPEVFAEHFSGEDRTVVEYVMDEVLDAQSAGVRRLLLAASTVDRVNAELSAELADDEGGRMFVEMVRRNSFIVPLGHGWYRYHVMFGQALRLIVRHEAPAETRELHRRAAGWLDRAGLLTEAVQQAALTGDWRYASWLAVDRLAIGQVLGLRPEGDLARCFQAMPADLVRTTSEPEPVIIAAAVALAHGQERCCATLLRRAETVLKELPDGHAPAARLSVDVVRQVLSGTTVTGVAGGTAAAVAAPALPAELSDQLLGDRPELRALSLLRQGDDRLYDGDLHEASRVFGEAVTAAVRAGGDFPRRACLGRLALTEALLGRFARADACAAQAAQPLGPSTALAGRRVAATHLAAAWASLERCRFGAARTELERAAQALGEQPDDFMFALHQMIRARFDVSQGRPEHALQALRRSPAAAPCPVWLERRMLLAASEALCACGSAAAARTAAENAGGDRSVESTVALTKATICAGDAAAATETLRPILTGSASAPVDVRVDAWLLDSYLSYQAGDDLRGRRSLDHALRLAGREQISLPFTLAKEWLRPVLRQDPEISRPYRRLLDPAQLALAPGGALPVQEEMPVRDLVERLSSRELDVLRNLAQMMTTEEIAVELCLSLNTVKTHLKSIYRKLGVTRRGEAVRRARRLELL